MTDYPMLKSALKRSSFPPEAFAELHDLIAAHASLSRKVVRHDAQWRKVPKPEGKVESVCEDCWEANVVWYADNDEWNRAVPDHLTSGDAVSFLCPRCFVLRSEKVTGEKTIWHLHRADSLTAFVAIAYEDGGVEILGVYPNAGEALEHGAVEEWRGDQKRRWWKGSDPWLEHSEWEAFQ